MAIGWINKSTQPAERTTFGESPSMSKAVRRYGKDGTKGDFPHGSTGRSHIEEIDRDPNPIAPSAPAHLHTERLPLGGLVKQVGFATDGSGRHATPDYGKSTRMHGSDGIPVARTDGASGQAHSASGGKFGKPTVRPAKVGNTGTRRADAGALAGESDGGKRDAYTGGKGRITP